MRKSTTAARNITVAALIGGVCSTSASAAVIAYAVADNFTTGSHGPNTQLVMGFTVNSSITVTHVGTYDSILGPSYFDTDGNLRNQPGYSETLQVGIYRINAGSDSTYYTGDDSFAAAVTPVSFSYNDAGMTNTIDGAAYQQLFKTVSPTTLTPGQYVIVSTPYYVNHILNAGLNGGVSPVTLNTAGGAITFQGRNYWGGNILGGGSSYGNGDGSTVGKYAAGTFVYSVPEPTSFGLLAAGAAGLLLRRRSAR